VADVFVSYARADREFVLLMRAALVANGIDCWIDLEDIPPAWQWRAEIAKAIDAADALIFVLSPESIASMECSRELEYAVSKAKRLIPVVCREVQADRVPGPLRELNWIVYCNREQIDPAHEELLEAIQIRPTTRLEQAIEWLATRWPVNYFNYGFKFREQTRAVFARLAVFVSVVSLFVDAFVALELKRSETPFRRELAAGAFLAEPTLYFPSLGIVLGLLGCNSRRLRKTAVVAIALSAASQIFVLTWAFVAVLR